MTGIANQNPTPHTRDGETRFKREDALAVAEMFVDWIQCKCERVEIAGSIRRGKVWVKDIEIVAVPKFDSATTNLFGEAVDPQNCLLSLLDHSVEDVDGPGPLIRKRLDKEGRQCYGPRHQRLTVQGVPLDLFQVIKPASWGTIFAIRTGPGMYSKNLVTSVGWGGHMPRDMRVEDGCLWRGKDRIDTPEEADFFAALGMPMPDPADRRNPI